MRAKLGISNEEMQDERFLVESLLGMMQKYGADYTNTFRDLTFETRSNQALFTSVEFTQWYEVWQRRVGRQQESKAVSAQLMQRSNPAVIPRNHRVEAALEAAVKRGL